MEPRIVLFAVVGLGLLGSLVVKRFVEHAPVSLPMIYVFIGWLLFTIFNLPSLQPVISQTDAKTIEYLTEFIVIISLATAGIAVDRNFSWKSWKQVWPLLAITMPLSILFVSLLGWIGLGLAPAAAILLGAVLSPTDPVLADSVQVGAPSKFKRNDVRFTLTLEAGANDGLAFPFTYLAIAAIGTGGVGLWTLEWFAFDVIWRIVAGVAVGFLVGRGSAWLVFRYTKEDEKAKGTKDIKYLNEGLAILGLLFASYGLAELISGYGFLAVFVAAVAVRQYEKQHSYHVFTHHFIRQIEQIVLIIMLIGLGGLFASGILSELTWQGALIGLIIVLVLRPALGYIAQLKSPLPRPGRIAVAFLGIRGMGTIYYIAYAQNKADFTTNDIGLIWSVALFVVLLSIIIHGMSARHIMEYVSRNKADVHAGK